jgi:hypothetical protein
MAGDALQGGDARAGPGDDAGGVGVGAACGVGVGRDRLGVGELMGEDVAERAELGGVDLAGAHRLDGGGVAGADLDIDRAAELLADQMADLVIEGDEAG